MSERPSLLAPQVERYLLEDEGEEIIDEVVKHPVTLIGPVASVLAGVLAMAGAGALGSFWFVPAGLGLVLAVTGLYRYHVRFMDRFVITNMRVFRVHGIFSRQVATMPLTRILDISVRQPWLGMLLDYGHFTFESAALEQGLHQITYVGSPRQRDLTIQRVIQRSGIRAMVAAGDEEDDGT
jgi:membrane protein YdbS with pleckstrin-like domain